MLHTVTNILKTIHVDIQPLEVRDVFRITTRDPENKTIILDLTSVLMKQKIIEKIKKYNKQNSKLTTETLKISGPVKPIFISENLSPKKKRLFFQARDYAKVNNFKYCWVSNGKIFLRKQDGAPLHLIKCESDLKLIKNPI